ncbi:hypothetical protein BJ165DRAFT_1441090 [Panaeolus papilionaceus]|nr:hypothetical protein BJ165DRAFT_1441090 [Panaeolus papilionaceus]
MPPLMDFEIVVQAISYVDSALRNPHKPTGCVKSLSVALSIVTHHPPWTSDEYQSKRNSLQATLYVFLTAVRTDEELKAMMQTMARCQCHSSVVKNPFSFHYHSIQTRSKFVQDDVQQFLFDVIGELGPHLNPARSTTVHKGHSKAWPTRVSELLPLGADQLVATILQWHRLFPHPMMARFAHHILKTCGDLVHDAYMKADVMNTLLVAPTRKYVDDALACTTRAQVHELTLLFAYQAITFVRYLNSPIDNTQPHGTAAKLMGGAETKIIQLCSLILYIVGSPHHDKTPPLNEDLPDIEREAVRFGQPLFRRYKMDRAPGPPMRLHPRIVALDRNQPHADLSTNPFQAVALAMYAGRFKYTCTVPGCQTRFIDPDAQLRTCVGCQTVRYCGKSCQTKDWKEGPFTHKKVCKIMSRILEVFGPWNSVPSTTDSPTGNARQDDINRRGDIIHKLSIAIYMMSIDGRLNGWEVDYIGKWAIAVMNIDYFTGGWNPGYGDYEDLLERFEKSRLFNAPKAEPMGPRIELSPQWARDFVYSEVQR